MALPNSKKNLNSVLKDLLKGQETANRLSALIMGSEEGKVLMGDILDTFTRVISALEIDEAHKEGGSAESAGPKSKISNKKRKEIDGSDQSGGSRRSVRQTSSRVIRNTIEDGQAWRKYGQKEILNSKNPRSYFRCTHKFDQGCKAQKQVQKSEEDPTMFIITYMGNHTCNNASSLPQIIQNFPHDNSSRLISFKSNPESSNSYNNPDQANIATTSVQPLKQDGEEDVLSNLTMADLTAAGDSDPTAPTSEQTEDRGDVTSSLTYSIGDLDMPLMVPQFNLDEELASLCDYLQFR